MTARFFLPAGQWTEATPTLSASESHHALDVLRLGVGGKITVFDGAGREGTAQIVDAAKNGLGLKILQQSKQARPPALVTLAQAIPKGKNMDLIIQKAVELGASRIVPLLSDRTVVSLDADDAAKKKARWEEIALEACKQCGQNWVPEITLPRDPKSAFDTGSMKSDLMLIASLQPDAQPLKKILAETKDASGRAPASVTILVGPEGDFTPAELGLAKSNGCRPLTLGPIILRTETAAIYCLSILAHELFMAP